MERLTYRIERIEPVQNRVDVHLTWTIPKPGKQIQTVSDTVTVYPTANGPISQVAIEHAIKNRAETFIRPTYLFTVMELDDTVSALVGTEGEIGEDGATQLQGEVAE